MVVCSLQWNYVASSRLPNSVSSVAAPKLQEIMTTVSEQGQESYQGINTMAILQTISKHQFELIQNNALPPDTDSHFNDNETVKPKQASKTSKQGKTLPMQAQPDPGILMMASAIVGQMFKYYQRNMGSFSQELKAMACLTVTSKKERSNNLQRREREIEGDYMLFRLIFYQL